MTRVLGIDPGDRRIGIAVSDPTGTIASPYGFIDISTSDPVTSIAAIALDMDCDRIVVGLPLRLDGSEGPSAQRSRTLGALLSAELHLDVVYADERFTTLTAEAALLEGNVRRSERKTRRDQVAAAVMLQGYLDRQAHDDRDGDASSPT